ncbi:MAG: CDP-glucose 4,6-dehydratase [Bacillota bacterium]|nr:CDP-glucose 4,6-dehydratase [Bacillota bacterium]MDY0118894.1 CDP-glucose 4,6-dehydratase [Bacilli bacterium]HOF65398.1 CDP-glucose 4,6-dehydratase [Bacilli bacterium]
MDLSFYKNKTVLITGHTGFKGSWLSEILILAGAKVIGYSLEPPTTPNLFTYLKLKDKMVSIIADIRDLDKLNKVFEEHQPEIVFHLAAQPIVRISYSEPVYTYDVNVMGTVNICECVRKYPFVKSFLNVTTDKVYENDDIPDHPFKEDEKLNGYDPYSNSKSCSELVTDSYNKSFFKNLNIPVSTARSGNVIGGGDFSKDRIIPDAARALNEKKALVIRNPHSTRPYQHVLEPLACYLLIAKEQYFNHALCGAYNIGPDSCDFSSTIKLIELFSKYFDGDFKYMIKSDNGPHEAAFLSLDNNKIKKTFRWTPKINIKKAVEMTAEWYDVWRKNGDLVSLTKKQIMEFFNE